jgi:hypothetical protein
LRRIDGIIPSHVYNKRFIVKFPDRSEQKNEFQSEIREGLIWYTDGSKTIKGIGTGCKIMAQVESLATALGNIPQHFRQERVRCLYYLPVDSHHHHKPEVDVPNLI